MSSTPTDTLGSQETLLIYSDGRSIKINRKKVATSCKYFEHLLEGDFKESRQHSVRIGIGDMFSFEAFECLVAFANDGVLRTYRPDSTQHVLYMEAIQLAMIWDYRSFVEVVEKYFIDHILIATLVDLSTLARRNRSDLPKLYQACEDFNQQMERRQLCLKWSRCSVDGHEHHYIDCSGPKDSDESSDWDRASGKESY